MKKDIVKVINSLGNTFEAIMSLPRLQCRRNWRGIGAPPIFADVEKRRRTLKDSLLIFCPFFLDLLLTLNV